MIPKEKAEKLEAALKALEDLDHPALKACFEQLYGKAPPKRIGKTLLILAIAFEMQRKAHGARTDRLFQRLAKYDMRKEQRDSAGTIRSETPAEAHPDGERRRVALSRSAGISGENAGNRPSRRPAIKRTVRPGGRLIREWQGRTYEVFVAEDACYIDGKKYASLSAAASAITGVKRNGPAFFGLRSPRVLQP